MSGVVVHNELSTRNKLCALCFKHSKSAPHLLFLMGLEVGWDKISVLLGIK